MGSKGRTTLYSIINRTKGKVQGYVMLLSKPVSSDWIPIKRFPRPQNVKKFLAVFLVDMVDSQRQQAEERALKMKSVLVKTKKELAEAKKKVRSLPNPTQLSLSLACSRRYATG